MKLVLKYGGTSISNTKNIQAICNHVSELSKKHQIAIVCSATSGTTDDLIEISESIKKKINPRQNNLPQKLSIDIINWQNKLSKTLIFKKIISKIK